MSIDLSGRDQMVTACSVEIRVAATHPLLELSNLLPWRELMDIIVEDLKSTTPKGMWWLGRRIRVRLHLAVYLLQKLYNLTDRGIEYALRDNAAYQLFSGKGIVADWHAPDHTSIEDFRNRLTPATQKVLANKLATVAVDLGFGDPSEVDFDSTVQEANMAYPSDANLMNKLAAMGGKLIDYLGRHMSDLLPKGIRVDLKTVRSKVREYLFLSKRTPIEKKRKIFKELHVMVKKQMKPIIDFCVTLTEGEMEHLPRNIHKTVDTLRKDAWRYLLDVAHFVRTHSLKKGKILSFHAKEVACISKGKVGKAKEFGRVFQLGRIKGNFLFVLESTDIIMHDKLSLAPLIAEHAQLFGERTAHSVTADKGYWSMKNQDTLTQHGVKESGLQRPVNIKNKKGMPCEERQEELANRRAGIEPIIGHAKQGGQLGKSRMKSDQSTLAAGYGSITGLNLRQLIRHQGGKMRKVA